MTPSTFHVHRCHCGAEIGCDVLACPRCLPALIAREHRRRPEQPAIRPRDDPEPEGTP